MKRKLLAIAASVVGIVSLAACAKDDPAPPTVAERLALAKQDAVQYTEKEQCHPIRAWPVVIPAESVPLAWPLDRDSLETLRRLGMVSRRDKQVDSKAADGHAFKRPMLVYELTAKARPFTRAMVGADGIPKTELCFGRLTWKEDGVDIDPYLEAVGTSYAMETAYRRHDALMTPDGKGVMSRFEYGLAPDRAFDVWADEVVSKLGGDAQFRKQHDDDLDRLHFLVYMNTNTVRVVVENRGSGWKVVKSGLVQLGR